MLAVVLLGCSDGSGGAADSSAAQGYPVTVADCGKDVTVAKAPERVLTVGTAAVEILDAAGASQKIIARTGEFGAPLPASLTHRPDDSLIVDPSDPTTENIIVANPDLVFGYGLFNADPAQIRKSGITMLTVQGECGHDASTDAAPTVDLGTIGADVRRLGTVFGTSATADAAASALDKRIAAARRAPTGHTAAWVYYFSSEDPLSAYGGSGLPNAMLNSAGLQNAYADQHETYATISTESLIRRQPEWIVVKYGGYGESEADARAKFLAEPGVSTLEAVRAGRIVMLPADSSNPSPSAVDSFEKLVAATAATVPSR
ncbi:ABC transporter substrate-binding protein [Gordonia sp. L191]|uniref:ABC transporter substrate-binding protein n=1 Tax=Gordonia sp. L191 TaxID=2982699 RepID=UPI0024BF332D|nr:ABC transporter substrate-binding protein [Gordonia sp. L191]WHU46135.1 ABC transporter substrate-binding protein [Gordonia sp. L191]